MLSSLSCNVCSVLSPIGHLYVLTEDFKSTVAHVCVESNCSCLLLCHQKKRHLQRLLSLSILCAKCLRPEKMEEGGREKTNYHLSRLVFL